VAWKGNGESPIHILDEKQKEIYPLETGISTIEDIVMSDLSNGPEYGPSCT